MHAPIAVLPCSLFGQDVIEFVIKPDKPSGQLVTYRSMAGSVKYIWPIQVRRGRGGGGGGGSTIGIYRRGAGSSLLGDSHNGKSNSTSRQVSW